MEPFQERVVTEKAELDDKLSRLKPFVTGEKFKSLPNAEQERMIRQLHLMEEYSQVLGQRIEAFGKS